MLYLDNITVTFAKNTILEKKALSSLNLRINSGDFITLIGNNGAGKSTLQGVIAGDIKIDSGKIFVNNLDITNTKTDQRAKFIARVFQDPRAGTCEDLTIAENMSIAYNRGTERKMIFALDTKRKELFKAKINCLEMGLEKRLDEPVKSLSGGQRQALSLLMATLSPAELLLLDEHTAALDPKMADQIMKLTDKLHKELNLTILMITHDIRQALEYGSRTLMLQEGMITKDLDYSARTALDPTALLSTY